MKIFLYRIIILTCNGFIKYKWDWLCSITTWNWYQNWFNECVNWWNYVWIFIQFPLLNLFLTNRWKGWQMCHVGGVEYKMEGITNGDGEMVPGHLWNIMEHTYKITMFNRYQQLNRLIHKYKWLTLVYRRDQKGYLSRNVEACGNIPKSSKIRNS